MAERVGQFLGNYQLLHLLGRGAFAEVYLAEHRYLEILAAIKVLHVRMEPDTHEQFRREARTIAHLQHRHIIRVHDFGFQDQIPYLVMEYSPNGTLRTRHPKGTRLTLEQIILYLKQIAPALDYAHQQRVIHRDVKPENMLLSANDEVVLSDFGIAVVQQSLDSLSTQSQAGTPIYMAPEQIQRKPCAASDQYALGVLVYEWLCGEPPFRGSLFEVLSQHLYQPPPSLCARLPDLPQAVEDAVFGALAKEPRERFDSVQDFAEVLQKVGEATQTLSVHVPSERPSPEQLAPSETLPRPIYPPSSLEQEDFSTVTQPLALPRKHSEDTEGQVALQVLPPVAQTYASSKDVVVPISRTNRQRLLRKVRAFWIAGVLKHSLHGAALLALGLQEQSDAVARPWQLVLQHPATAPRPLPTGIRITQVYDGAEGELLILGAPGSGKSTLLLELARDLLSRAEREEQHPLPVVFNLSSWASKQQLLADWLVEELSNTYQVPRKLGQTWINADQILPLLDGLDEVAPGKRTTCIQAINTYRGEHGLLPLVVCSRSADYLAQTARVQLGSAVTVQPLTPQQVDDYLARGGEPLGALRVALQQDAALRELTSSPLMLSILTLTYHGKSIDDLLAAPSPAAQRQEVFSTYVERMLERRGNSTRYTPQQTISWLTWLAGQLVRHNQTVFYLERMQPDWLPEGRVRNLYPQLVTGLLYGLISMVGFWLIFGTMSTSFPNGSSPGILNQLGIGLGVGLAGGLLFGLLNGLLSRLDSENKPNNPTSETLGGVGRTVLRAVLNGLLFTLVFEGASYILLGSYWNYNSPSDFLLSNLPTALVSSLVFGVIDVFLGKQVRTNIIKPAEVVAWSWAKMGWNLLKFLFIGVLVAVVSMLLLGLFFALRDWFTYRFELLGVLLSFLHSISGTLVPALIAFVVLFELLGGLTGGLSSSTLDEQNLVKPNQGIRRSVRNGLLVGSVVGLVVMLIGDCLLIVLLRTSTPQPSWSSFLAALLSMLGLGLVVGLVIGLQSGGIACLQHLLLRLLLWRTRSILLNYSRFLDYTAERILLRKVGGGYIFVHRLLLEYFAPKDTGVSSAGVPVQTAQTSDPFETRVMPNLSPLRSISHVARFPLLRISRRTALLGLASLTGLIAVGGGALWISLPHPLYAYRRNANGVNTVAWSPDGKYIASGGYDDTVQVWAASDGQPIYTYQQHTTSKYIQGVNTVIWSPDSKRIASVGNDGAILAWDATDGKHVVTYHKHEAPQVVSNPQIPNSVTVQTPDTGIIDVAWSVDGKQIMLTNHDGTVQIWDDSSGTSLSIIHLRTQEETISTLAWSSDRKHIASLNDNGVMKVWDAGKGILIATYQTQIYGSGKMVWSPDGKHIALISYQDVTVRVLNAANGRFVSAYHKHGGSIQDIAWSPDSKFIASGSEDQTVQVWDAASGNMVRLYWLPSGGVSSMTWSPNGKRIASGNFDFTVSVWQVF